MTPRLDFLSWAALGAAIVVTASGEYQLGIHAGFGPIIAAGIPASLDIYALRAMRMRRDVAVVVLAMIVVNGLSHLVSTGLLPVNVPLVVAVSAIAPLVFWRVHRLAHNGAISGDAGAIATPSGHALRWADAVPAGAHLLPIVAGCNGVATVPVAVQRIAVAALCAAVAPVAVRPRAWVGAAPAGARLLDAWPLCCTASATPAVAEHRGETMTTGEVAEFCHVSADTVRSWKSRGKLTPVATGPDGKSLLFAAADVIKLPGES